MANGKCIGLDLIDRHTLGHAGLREHLVGVAEVAAAPVAPHAAGAAARRAREALQRAAKTHARGQAPHRGLRGAQARTQGGNTSDELRFSYEINFRNNSLNRNNDWRSMCTK